MSVTFASGRALVAGLAESAVLHAGTYLLVVTRDYSSGRTMQLIHAQGDVNPVVAQVTQTCEGEERC